MKLVIEIPEEDYKTILSRMKNYSRDIDEEIRVMASAIANGKQLPKGHGELIDRGQALNECYRITVDGDGK